MLVVRLKQIATNQNDGMDGRAYWDPDMTGDSPFVPVEGFPIVVKPHSGAGVFISSPVQKIEPMDTEPDVTGFRCTTKNSVYEFLFKKKG